MESLVITEMKMVQAGILLLMVSGVVIWFVAADPQQMQPIKARSLVRIEEILRKAETGGCYRAIVLPSVIDDRSGPSGKIEAGAPDYAVIPSSEIATFFGLLKKRKPCDGLEFGMQYELTLLMEDSPTSPMTILMFRKVGKAWYLYNLEEKFEMTEEFSKWMNERMLKMEEIEM